MPQSTSANQDETQDLRNLDSVLQAWTIGGKCPWPHCTSRASFNTRALFRKHLTNVHKNPLLCSAANCPHKTPFGRPTDLRRHMQSVHSGERKYVCSIASCDARIKEFARKDHLNKHMRERHDSYFCPIYHCFHSTKGSFAKPEDLTEHLDNYHGPYECAIRGCDGMPPSKFSQDSLESHLKRDHGVEYYSASQIVRNTIYDQSLTVTSGDVVRYICHECVTCEKQRHVTERTPDDSHDRIE